MRTLIMVLLGGIALLVWGCASPPPAQRVVATVPLEREQSAEYVGAEPEPRAAGPCLEQYGFAVLDFRAVRDDYDRVSVFGEITNAGIVLKGVELQATLRSASGRLTAVGHFYPASYKNIRPGETWPFTYSFGRQPDATRAELRIVGTFRTSEVPGVAPLTP